MLTSILKELIPTQRFYFLANTALFFAFIALIYTPINVLGICSSLLILLSVMYFIQHPHRLLQALNSPYKWMFFIGLFYFFYNLGIDYSRGELNEHELGIYFSILIAPLLLSYCNQTKWQSKLLFPATLIASAISFYYVYPFLAINKRFSGESFNTIYWSMLACIQLVFSTLYFCNFIKQNRFILAALALFPILFSLATMVSASSKGAFVCLLLSILLSPFFIFKKIKHIMAFTLLSVLLTFTSIYSVFSLFPNHILIKRFSLAINKLEHFTEKKSDASSTSIRLQLYSAAINSVTINPLIGLSDIELDKVRKSAVDAKTAHPSSLRFYHLHSDFMHSLGTKGIVGLITYLLMLCLFIPITRKFKHQFEHKIAASFLIIFIGMGLFETMMASGLGAMVYVLFLSSFYGLPPPIKLKTN
jgi:hypothetical protein